MKRRELHITLMPFSEPVVTLRAVEEPTTPWCAGRSATWLLSQKIEVIKLMVLAIFLFRMASTVTVTIYDTAGGINRCTHINRNNIIELMEWLDDVGVHYAAAA